MKNSAFCTQNFAVFFLLMKETVIFTFTKLLFLSLLWRRVLICVMWDYEFLNIIQMELILQTFKKRNFMFCRPCISI